MSVTAQKVKVSEKPNGTPIVIGDNLVWYEEYRNMWFGGKVIRNAQSKVMIQGAGFSFNEFEWAVAEGRVQPNHIVVANREDTFTNHEIKYMKRQ